MITFRKLPSLYSSPYEFVSREKDEDGLPLYSFKYQGIEKNHFHISHKGKMIAQIIKEEDVRDFIQNHYIGYLNGKQLLAEGVAL
jgi:hypothetical protein